MIESLPMRTYIERGLDDRVVLFVIRDEIRVSPPTGRQELLMKGWLRRRWCSLSVGAPRPIKAAATPSMYEIEVPCQLGRLQRRLC